MSDVRQWLDSLGHVQHAGAFEDNALDLDIVADLTEEHLKDLGVAALGHWGQVCAGEGQIALISGEAGIGKSRFLRGVR